MTSTSSPRGWSRRCRACIPTTRRSARSTTPRGWPRGSASVVKRLPTGVRRGTLLACRTAEGHLLYPLLQFGRHAEVRPGVVDAVGILGRAGADGWTIATWLTTPSPVFSGQSAVDHLVLHRSSQAAVDLVVAAAEADAARWAA